MERLNSKLDAWGWLELARKAPTDQIGFLFEVTRPLTPDDVLEIEKAGVSVGSIMGTIGTGRCEAQKLESFSQMAIIKRVEFSRPLYPR